MIINNGPIGSGKFNPLKDILIDGVKITNLNTANDKYKFYIRNGNDLTRWELAILKNCNIKFKKKINADIFMVGGGKDGKSGGYDDNTENGRANGNMAFGCHGGDGGAGGAAISYPNTLITSNIDYSIIIGNNINDTSGFGHTVLSGGGSAGGTGAQIVALSRTKVATTGTSSITFAFSTSQTSCFYPITTFGAGGGGAYCQGYHQNIGPVDNDHRHGNNAGGLTGGGRGGSNNSDGSPGLTNTGGGGGGGGCTRNGEGGGSWKNGGAGGSGIIIIHPNNFAGWEESDFITINSNQE